MREVARFNCLWAVYNKAAEKAGSAKVEPARRAILTEEALPVRAEMAAVLKRIFDALLRTVGNTGELGTIANWEQHLLPGAWERPEAELAKMLGSDLPPDVLLSRAYSGPLRVFVPAVRTSLEVGEALTIRAVVRGKGKPETAALRWREMGRGEFRSVPLEHKARGVYAATIPPFAGAIEYYVEVKAGGEAAFFPSTAPAASQTVIVLPVVK